MELSGKEPEEELKLLADRYSNKLSRFFKWSGKEYWCDVCGKIFDSQGALNFHKTSSHFNTSVVNNARRQWDFGQMDLQNGVNALWNGFMKEHDLQKVVFLYGDEHVYSKYRKDRFMPFFYKDKLYDTLTCQKLDAICFNDNWLKLDPDAKAASLAHTAAHLENYRQGVNDLTFNRQHHHTSQFRDIALTYDLYVQNVPEKGFAMTRLTDKFREKHRWAMTAISKYHYLVEYRGHREIRCDLDIVRPKK